MKKKLKICLCVIAAVVLLVAGWFGLQAYYYYHPQFEAKVGTPLEPSDYYVGMVSVGFTEKSIWGANPDFYTDSADVLDKINEQRSVYLGQYKAPTNIKCTVDTSGSTMTVVFSGNATDMDGKECQVYDKMEFGRFW